MAGYGPLTQRQRDQLAAMLAGAYLAESGEAISLSATTGGAAALPFYRDKVRRMMATADEMLALLRDIAMPEVPPWLRA